jgi:alpha-1,6-mannosyltransferase
MAETQVTQAAPGLSVVLDQPGPVQQQPTAQRGTGLSRRILALGFIGSVVTVIGILGAGGDLIQDPILGNGPLSWIRYGHGRYIADVLVYLGIALLVWAWVQLGRDVIAFRVRARGVLLAATAWIAPMVISPPAFTRDVFSYLGQGEEALRGIDPYSYGPSVLNDAIALNVHPFWQNTPAPYGPLFILLAKIVAWIAGEHLIVGVILMRLVLMIGLGLLIWSLPGLVRHLGGRLSVALWLMVANPMVVIHLVGGPHNDLLMIGLLAMGTLLVLDRKHVAGITLVTLAMAVKATAGVALPFLVWVWAGRIEGTLRRRFIRATAASLGVFIVVFGLVMLVSWQNFGWISALQAPTLIVNWVNLPTGIGQLLHNVVGIFGDLPVQPFTNLTRGIGIAILAVVSIRQWWKAREGGAEAVRRMGIVLLAVAIIAPPTLPWYLTWGMAILCAVKWTDRWLAFAAGLSVLILLVYYPDGESAMESFSHMVWVIVLAIVAGVSMRRVDPLGLRGLLRRTRPTDGADASAGGVSDSAALTGHVGSVQDAASVSDAATATVDQGTNASSNGSGKGSPATNGASVVLPAATPLPTETPLEPAEQADTASNNGTAAV